MKTKAKKVTEQPKPATAGTKAVATRRSSAVQTQGQGVGGRGFENVERKDILIPRIMLLQALSPAVTSEIAKAGTMHTSLTNVNLGAKIVITPVMHFRSRIKWVPRDDGGGIECSSPDGRKPLNDIISAECGTCACKDWDDSKKGMDQAPACTMYENFIVLVGDSTEPIMLPMEKTKLKTAKKLYSMGALKNADMWTWQYELSVSKEKNAKDQPYFSYVITDLMLKTKPARMTLCERIYNSLSKKTITTDMVNDEETAGTGAAAPTGEQKF